MQVDKNSRPNRRRRIIRDLPKDVARFLHPSLRSILMSHQKRWNKGSPHYRIAVNLKNRYCRSIKPRILPFYCDACHLSTRRLDLIRHHPCDEEEKKKLEKGKRCVVYDFNQDLKMAHNAFKFLRKDGMAVMEKTPKPQHVVLPYFDRTEEPTSKLTKVVPTLQELCYNALEFDVPFESTTIDKVMTRPAKKRINVNKCKKHVPSGLFCFRCRRLFDNYDTFSKHFIEEREELCKSAIPEFQHIQTFDMVGTMPPDCTYRERRHIPIKRDVSHVRCTLCQAGNFESTDSLYSHMLKCTN